MKAIRVHQFGGPEVLQCEDVERPVAAEGEVVVRIEAAGINPVEAYIRTGTYARKPALPYTPGSDGAGVVEQAGRGVDALRVGDRVYVAALMARRNTGTYAEYVACDAAHVHPLPDQVTFHQGAAIGVPYATAYRALVQRARLVAGETVLVHGASGSVGTACVQLARALGARVIGTAGSDAGLALVAAEGAHGVAHHARDGYLDAILAMTANRGADVIVEMLANVNLERDFSVLAPYGRIVIVGSRGTLEFSPRLTMGKDASILGMALWNIPPTDVPAITAGVNAGVAAGYLRPVTGRAFPLAQASDAHRAVLEPGAHGKIALLPR